MPTETNIYYLHPDAKTSASWIHDKHLVNLIISSGQMLSTACQMIMLHCDDCLYPINNPNHVCNIWLRSSIENAQWLLAHMKELTCIYEDLYHKDYRSHALVKTVQSYILNFPRTPFTDPPLAIPDQYILEGEPVYYSYRNYYINEKAKGDSYRRVKVPYWVNEAREERFNARMEELGFADESTDMRLLGVEDIQTLKNDLSFLEDS